MQSASLYDRPDLYDLVSPPNPFMERFYVDAAGGAGKSVLDLACGTGRLTLPIARSGAIATGGDLSQSMLDQARNAAREQSLDVRFVALDMRDFELAGQEFARIFVAANSLLHLESQVDFAGFFRSVARHLSSDGQLIFDIFVPNIALLASDPVKRQIVGEFAHPTLGPIRLEETIRYDPLTQVSHIDWFWSDAHGQDFWHSVMHMRQIFPEELHALLSANGFRLLARFGDFDRTPMTATSARQVCVCAPV